MQDQFVETFENYDVVVVGHGVSGLSAGISAHESGASTVILEKSPKARRGGHTHHAGGLFRFPMEDPQQVRDELSLDSAVETYTQQDFYDDLMEVSKNRADPKLCRELVSNAYDAIKWVTEHGVSWHVVDHSDEPGFGTTIGCVQADGQGAGVVESLTKEAERLGIDIQYETEFHKLNTDQSNRVESAEALGPAGKIKFLCEGVIISAGSYVANAEKRTRYFGRDGERYVVRGSRDNTGEGIDAAITAGAKPVGHWGGAHQVLNDAAAADVEEGRARINGYQYSLIMNSHGERFLNEGEDFLLKTYAKFGQKVYDQPDQQAFIIFDSKVDDLVVSQIDNEPVVADTLPELFDKIDVDDVDAAIQTIEEFNRSTGDGEFDPHSLDGLATDGLDIEKTNWALPLDEPPFKCFPARSAVTFAFGGLEITTEGQVLDTREKPIPGLWAVGNSTAKFFHGNYPGGSALSRGATFGYKAGREAAKYVNEKISVISADD